MQFLLLIALLPALALCAPQQSGAIQDGKLSLHCKFVPKMTFFAADKTSYPIYECKSGDESIVLWLASEDFRSPNNANEWIDEADIALPQEAVQTAVVGAYRAQKDSPYSAVSGLKLASPNVSVKGLSIRKSPEFSDSEPVTMPNVGLTDVVKNWFGSKKN